MLNSIQSGLTDRFLESAEAVGATVETIQKSPEELNASLQKATSDDKSILLAEPDYLSLALFEIFLRDRRVVTKPTKEQLSSITTGVTDAFCAVASTGSVCVSVSRNLGSPASLLTRKHIAIVDARTIVPRPRDIFSRESTIGGSLMRSFSFITGPSATADMGPLVVGVHGPGRLHIIVLV
ncbi:MAG: LutC/YkgG family protein [Candidatus Kryptoniota bacterium]